MHSSDDLLKERGYLTINQLTRYLKECHPALAMSFPVLKRYCQKEGSSLPCVEVGGQFRVLKSHIDAYVAVKMAEIEGSERASPSLQSQFRLPPKLESIPSEDFDYDRTKEPLQRESD